VCVEREILKEEEWSTTVSLPHPCASDGEECWLTGPASLDDLTSNMFKKVLV